MVPISHASRGAGQSRARGYARSLVVAAVIAGLSWTPRPAAAKDVPAAFIGSLGDQALSVIRRPDLSLSGKAAYFRQMILQDFDMPGIARFVLGPYWRVASPGEQREFCDLLTQRLIRVYGRRLAQAGDGDFVVSGSRNEPDGGVTVASRIVPRQGAPIGVDWRLAVTDGRYAIEDVAIDGVGMALAERSEIAAQIGRQGGHLEMLLAEMRDQG